MPGTTDGARDTPSGAEAFYPGVVIHLGTMLTSVAERAADLLPSAVRMLDVGAGAAPCLAVAARDHACLVTAVDLPTVVNATRGPYEPRDACDRLTPACVGDEPPGWIPSR